MKRHSRSHAQMILRITLKNLDVSPNQKMPSPVRVAEYLQTLVLDLSECDGWKEDEKKDEVAK